LKEAEFYCLKLLDFSGNEKEQAKSILKEIKNLF
jgi:hypothetical protein